MGKLTLETNQMFYPRSNEATIPNAANKMKTQDVSSLLRSVKEEMANDKEDHPFEIRENPPNKIDFFQHRVETAEDLLKITDTEDDCIV